MSSRGRMQAATNSEDGTEQSASKSTRQGALYPKSSEDLSEELEHVLYWDDLKKKLAENLSTADFRNNIR